MPTFSIYFSVKSQSGNLEQEINFPNLPILITNSPFLHFVHFLPSFSVSILTLLATQHLISLSILFINKLVSSVDKKRIFENSFKPILFFNPKGMYQADKV